MRESSLPMEGLQRYCELATRRSSNPRNGECLRGPLHIHTEPLPPREFAFCGQLAKVFASPLGGLSTALRADYSRSGQPVLLQEIANQGIGCRKQS